MFLGHLADNWIRCLFLAIFLLYCCLYIRGSVGISVRLDHY